MGFQSSINRSVGAIAGGIIGVKHGLDEYVKRQRKANDKAEAVKDAKETQKKARVAKAIKIAQAQQNPEKAMKHAKEEEKQTKVAIALRNLNKVDKEVRGGSKE